MEFFVLETNIIDNEEIKGNKNKKFNLKYKVENEKKKIILFGENFVKKIKNKCYLIINNNDCELMHEYKFPQKGEQTVTLVITVDDINFSQMFSNFYLMHRMGFTFMDYNPYLIDISSLKNLDVSECKDLSGMFNGCTNIQNFEFLKNWDVSKCESFEGMFAYCNFSNLSFLSSWNFNSANNLSAMFKGCKKLNNVEGCKNWNVENVIYFEDMFNGCKGLIDVNALQNWNMNKAERINGMFCKCNNLENMDSLYKWKLNNGIFMGNIIIGCDKLKNIPSIFKGSNCTPF